MRSVPRQDPDLLFADEVRTLEDLRMLCTGAETGHGTVCVLEAMPGVPIVAAHLC